jgi:glycerophosphoryl diester phosphodiesterase
MKMILNIAHRGGAGLAPENTLSCFLKGSRYADILELDVQPSKDKHLMVFHDRQGIERTTNGRGRIPDLNFDYLRSLDAGSWFHPDFRGEVIPTLDEVLGKIGNKIKFNIELKYYDPESDWFENEVMKTVNQFNVGNRSIITARYPENIIRIQQIDSDIECTLLQKERDKSEYFELIKRLDLKIAQIRKPALERDYIKRCHDAGVNVFFFYADNPSEMRYAINLGVDGILTNYPDKLKQILTKEI